MSEEINFFYHHICHFCKTISINKKLCSGCKSASYCSKDHQKKDWKDHKPFCQIVQEYLKVSNSKQIFDLETKDADKLRSIQLILMSFVEISLERALKISEKQMILFPNVCPVCHRFIVDKRFTCSDCAYVAYCSLEHKDVHLRKHKTECTPLQICYKIDKLIYESKLSFPDFEIHYLDETSFPKTMESYVIKYAGFNDMSGVMLSENISGILSLCYALNFCEDFCKLDELTIHIIGASNYEQSVLMTAEHLFHRFPWLNKINLVLIGPNVCEDYLLPVLCKKCEHKALITSKEKKLYHDYVTSKGFVEPNVIFSFNCGFSELIDAENDTWIRSLNYVWNYDKALIAFTSYTESEAKLDLEGLMKSKTNDKNYSTYLQLNPYKSMRPYRNWEDFESAIFYNNNYITVVKLKI